VPARTGSTSPSTIRRQLAAAERDLHNAAKARDQLLAEIASVGNDHVRLAELGVALTRSHAAVEAAEGAWLELADAAESLGLEV
jgi:hypothetical protein